MLVKLGCIDTISQTSMFPPQLLHSTDLHPTWIAQLKLSAAQRKIYLINQGVSIGCEVKSDQLVYQAGLRHSFVAEAPKLVDK